MNEQVDFVFDSENPNWHQTPEYNELFLEGIRRLMNHRLESLGHVFLNDVLIQLDIPRTSGGQVLGWTEGSVDFGPLLPDEDGSIRLHFNVNGNILDSLD